MNIRHRRHRRRRQRCQPTRRASKYIATGLPPTSVERTRIDYQTQQS
jgi:hypothetical protein